MIFIESIIKLMSIRGRLRSSSSANDQSTRATHNSSGLGQCVHCAQQDPNDSMLTCSLCETQYHPNCLQLQDEILSKSWATQWSCQRCRQCFNCGKKGKFIRQIRHNSQPNKQALITCNHCDSFPIHFNCYKKLLTSRKRAKKANLLIEIHGKHNNYFVCKKCEKDERKSESENNQVDEDEEEEVEEEEEQSDEEDEEDEDEDEDEEVEEEEEDEEEIDEEESEEESEDEDENENVQADE